MKKEDYFQKVVQVLKDLKKDYPCFDIGRHISAATSDYDDIWGLPDKELYLYLKRYREALDVNKPPTEEDINKIVEDGMNLNSLMSEEEDY